MKPLDVVARHVPGGWSWWRLYIGVTVRRGRFEDSNGWMYAGCLHRWARRVGPINVAFMRLIGDRHEPYRADRAAALDAEGQS